MQYFPVPHSPTYKDYSVLVQSKSGFLHPICTRKRKNNNNKTVYASRTEVHFILAILLSISCQ